MSLAYRLELVFNGINTAAYLAIEDSEELQCKAALAEKRAESWELCRSVILKFGYGLAPCYCVDESAGELHVKFPAKGDKGDNRVVNFAPTATTLVEAADQVAKAGLNAVVHNRQEVDAIVWKTLALMIEPRCAMRGLSIFDFKYSVEDSGRPILLRLDGARIADSVKCKETLRIPTLPIIGSMIDSFLDRYSSKNACEPSSNSKPS